MGSKRHAYKILIERPERKPLRRPRRRFKDRIKMNLKRKRERNGMDWIYLAQDRDQLQSLVSRVMNFQVP
jgi:hypothetical protein